MAKMTPEKRVKNEVVKQLKLLGAYYFFPATYGYGRSGVPDIICCYRGRFVAIECKAGNNTITKLQHREIEAIKRQGGVACVITEDTAPDIGAILQVIVKEI